MLGQQVGAQLVDRRIEAGAVAVAEPGGGPDPVHRNVGADFGEQAGGGGTLALAIDRGRRRSLGVGMPATQRRLVGPGEAVETRPVYSQLFNDCNAPKPTSTPPSCNCIPLLAVFCVPVTVPPTVNGTALAEPPLAGAPSTAML